MIKDYTSHEAIDFAIDEDFIRWVIQDDPADRKFWDRWRRLHPEKNALLQEARNIVNAIGIKPPALQPADKDFELNRLFAALQDKRTSLAQGREARSVRETETELTPESTLEITDRKEVGGQHAPPRWMLRRRVWIPAAALLGLALTLGLYRLSAKDYRRQFEAGLLAAGRGVRVADNIATSALTLYLPDSTVVRLSPGSRFSYATDFSQSTTRDVYLSGQAFFQVAPNRQHPFHVFSHDLDITVLGTSFNVTSYDQGRDIQVAVISGKVRVGPLVLTPNQELVYDKQGKSYQRRLSPTPALLDAATAGEKWVFEAAPVTRIFRQLTQDYGIDIIYDSSLLTKCSATADLRGESLYRRLDLICQAIGADYKITDTCIRINTSGCQ